MSQANEITCHKCGKKKIKPNYKPNSTGLEFCSTECFYTWYETSSEQDKIDEGWVCGRPSLLKDRWQEFKDVILNERLYPQDLANRFDIKKTTAMWNRRKVLEENSIDLSKYNSEVKRENYIPKLSKETYLKCYRSGYWDFDKNKWVKARNDKELAKSLGASIPEFNRGRRYYKIKKAREDMPAGLDVKGKKFDLLRPVKLIRIDEQKKGLGKYLWLCQCDCGNECEKKSASLKNHHHNCNIKNSCGCENKKHARWKALDINTRHFSRIKSGAKKRGLEFDITPEFVDQLYKKQEKKSGISGKAIVMPGKVGVGSGLAQCPSDNKDNIASLDRIDSSKGYTIDNVWWISRRENSCKMDLSIEDVEQFFKDGYEYLKKSRKIRKAISKGVF